MSFGPVKEFENQHTLYDWVHDWGYGILTNYGEQEVPVDCLNFAVGQLGRFGFGYNDDLHDVAMTACFSAFMAADIGNPYQLFWGVSDVDMTDWWSKRAYELRTCEGKTLELDPEHIETFVYVPGQAEEMFNTYIAKPGLEALPNGIGYEIRDELAERMGFAEVYGTEYDQHDLEMQADLEILRYMFDDAEDPRVGMRSYVEICAWAAFLWLAGPEGRLYRMNNHPVMEAAITHGECLLFEGHVYDPGCYQYLDRLPGSCYRCGISAWCVEPSYTDGCTRWECERCMNDGMPLFPPANCGAKLCRYTLCPNHPQHSPHQDGLYNFAKEHGQLVGMAKQQSNPGLHGKADPPKLLN